MREHQIVITLKPEQFLEVQRLARSANAKSMGIFVRQQLLAALGIEVAAKGAGMTVAVPEIGPLVDELRRLHSELKAFVAESMTDYMAEPVANGGGEAGFGQLPQSSEQQGTGGDTSFPGSAEDELERLANRTFAISPRLGQVEPVCKEAPEDLASSDDFSDTRAGQSRPESGRHYTEGSQRYEVPHHRLEPIDWTQESAAPGQDSLVRDPLHELLGSADSVVPLPGAGSSEPGWDEDEDEDEFSVPLSLSERRRELSDAGEFQSGDLAAAADEPLVWPAPPGTALSSVPAQASSSVSPSAASSESAPVADPANPPPEPPPPGNMSGRLPFSGSPPPKRRR